jgi:hypothetical protein
MRNWRVCECKIWKFLVLAHLCIEILKVNEFLTISSSGTIMVRSGIIFSFMMHPVSSRNMGFRYISVSLNSMFWPFPGFLVPTMTSALKNQYRQPRFRVQLSQFDAVHVWLKVFSWTKTNFCLREFQVRGSNQDMYGQPMVSLWSARCPMPDPWISGATRVWKKPWLP